MCVSPLISLMMDQKAKLSSRGLACQFVGQAQEDEDAIDDVLNGKVQLVFISPENPLQDNVTSKAIQG